MKITLIWMNKDVFSSVQFSSSVVSDSLWPHELQHARPSCPSPTPGVHTDSRPSSPWCHPAISSSVVPFSFWPQTLQDQSLFNESTFPWSGQSTVASALTSFLPGFISFRMDWLDILSVKGNLKSLLKHHSSKASILWHSAFLIIQLLHPYMTTGKAIAMSKKTFVGKVMSLLFNMLSRMVIAFFPRSKRLLISWLQSPSVVIFGAPQNKVSHCFHCFPI